MAVRVTYSTTVTGFSTRAVRCTYCGEEYLYDMRRDAAAVETTCAGRNPEARFRASDRAHLELQRALQTAVDPVPCPSCGYYQPDMVAHLKQRRGRWLRRFGVFITLFALVPALGFFTTPQERDRLAVSAASFTCLGAALLLLWKIWAAWYNPNCGDPDRRKQLGRARAYRPGDADQLIRDRQRQPIAERPGDVGSRPLVTAVFLWLLAAVALFVGLGFTLTGAAEVSDAKDSPQWPSVPGQVTQSSMLHSGIPAFGTRTFIFRYSYTIAGRTYTAGKARFGWPQLSEAKVRQHPRGSAVTVYYKPGDPSVCVLEPGAKFPYSYATVLLGVAVLGLGVGFFAWGRARHRRYRELQEPGTHSPRWRELPAQGPQAAAQPLIRAGLDRGF